MGGKETAAFVGGFSGARVSSTWENGHGSVCTRSRSRSRVRSSSNGLMQRIQMQASSSSSGRYASRKMTRAGMSAAKEVLTADMFRHPVDVRATRLLRSLFGVEMVLRRVLSMAEEVFYLENLSNAVLVSEKQLPDIHELVMDSCRILCIEQVPQVYVRNNPQPNAYTLAFRGKRPFIVLHSSLVDLMTPEELKGVIAHELGHLKCEHGVWVTMANLIVLFAQSLGGEPFSQVTDALGRQVQGWLRAAELSCDRAGLLVVQDREVMFSILMKLCGGVGRGRTLDLNEYMKQIEMFEEATKSPFGRLMRRGMTEALTHPLPILRVKELDAYANSDEFKKLVRRSQISK